eukprot:MONOS_13087.1-p1 / transcript=MONOS_13087.1 / gene=MONOS_13087 / organism=Monocercomonoides_exilis_PA203 / gene_product=unspecified product / transcript_product=unspecified product / location=Mono_scaffold00776:25481-26903(+) / protein_length=447 / sequence_SO=supercontig / SO=protein_coding / is_pseudo=false
MALYGPKILIDSKLECESESSQNPTIKDSDFTLKTIVIENLHPSISMDQVLLIFSPFGQILKSEIFKVFSNQRFTDNLQCTSENEISHPHAELESNSKGESTKSENLIESFCGCESKVALIEYRLSSSAHGALCLNGTPFALFPMRIALLRNWISSEAEAEDDEFTNEGSEDSASHVKNNSSNKASEASRLLSKTEENNKITVKEEKKIETNRENEDQDEHTAKSMQNITEKGKEHSENARASSFLPFEPHCSDVDLEAAKLMSKVKCALRLNEIRHRIKEAELLLQKSQLRMELVVAEEEIRKRERSVMLLKQRVVNEERLMETKKREIERKKREEERQKIEEERKKRLEEKRKLEEEKKKKEKEETAEEKDKRIAAEREERERKRKERKEALSQAEKKVNSLSQSSSVSSKNNTNKKEESGKLLDKIAERKKRFETESILKKTT